MKIKKYTNGAWTDLDKPVKKYDTYTDEATSLPLTIETSKTDAVENYQVYGVSGGVGKETENLWDSSTNNFVDNVNINVTTGLPEQNTYYAYQRCGTLSPISVTGDLYTLKWDSNISTVVAIYSVLNGSTLVRRVSNVLSGDVLDTSDGDTLYVCFFDFAGIETIKITDVTNIMLVSGSTAPTSYIPHGYKLPLTVESGETKCEKIAGVNLTPDGVLDIYGAADAYSVWVAQVKAGETYTVTTDETFGTDNVILGYFTNYPKRGDITIDKKRYYESITFKALYTGYVAFRSSFGFEGGLIKVSSDIPIYIGSTKLGEEEYVDFGEQKIYKYVSGVLTPTDPPAPLPTIQTYIGENNLSVDTTVQPEKVAVEYEGWKGVGDVEKYQNGEWSDNNGT